MLCDALCIPVLGIKHKTCLEPRVCNKNIILFKSFIILCFFRLHGFFKFDWRDTFIKIDSIVPTAASGGGGGDGGSDGDGGFTVTRDAATPSQYPFTKGFRFYAVAALELLDVPGEYHIDKATGALYYLPITPLTAASDLVVSVLHNVVTAGADHTKFIGQWLTP